MTDYCEDSNKVFNVEKAKLAVLHSQEGHTFTTTTCSACDEDVCASCMVSVVKVKTIGVAGQCPYCGNFITYIC